MNEARMLGTAMDAVLLILSFARMHQIRICAPQFVFYLALVLSWGWMFLGDIAYWSDYINFGIVEQVGPGARLGVFRAIFTMGLVYVLIFGAKRKL